MDYASYLPSNKNRLKALAASLLLLLVISALLLPNSNKSKVLYAPSHQQNESLHSFSADSQIANVSTSSLRAAGAASGVRLDKGGSDTSVAFSRKLVRTGSLEAVVKSPAETAEKIRALTVDFGGYFEGLQITGEGGSQTATITIRIPSARFDEAKLKIHELSGHVDSEKTEATDVTKQYVDLEARLRNLRAAEAQYLQIMRSAKKVPDMLVVTEKLSDVRGEIEQQQAELATLSKQVETVALNVSLRAEQVAPAAEIHWHPIYDVKVAINDALDGLSSYVSAMIGILFELPVVLLWLATLTFGLFIAWKLFRWVAEAFFGSKKLQAKAAE